MLSTLFSTTTPSPGEPNGRFIEAPCSQPTSDSRRLPPTAPQYLLADAERAHDRAHQGARWLARRRLVGVEVAVAGVGAGRHHEAAGDVGAGPGTG
jgi:hypothetical protein